MIYFIHPEDSTTSFLSEVRTNIYKEFGSKNVLSYRFQNRNKDEACDFIKSIGEDNLIVYMGHGRSDRLYAVYGKDGSTFLKFTDMHLFDNKNVIFVACHSADLLKSSYSRSKISSSIGFGMLPTSLDEIEEVKKFKDLEVSEDDINKFCSILVDVLTQGLKDYINLGLCVDRLYSRMRLLMSRYHNESVLYDSNRRLAELVFQARQDMLSFRSSE